MTWLESGPGPRPEPGGTAPERPLGRLRVRPARPGADRRPAAPRGSRSPSSSPPADATPTPTWSSGDGSEPGVLGAGGPRPRRRVRRRHRQRHDQPVAGRRGPPDQPVAVRRRPAEPAGQRAAVRRDGDRRPARADRGGRARGLRAAVHPVAVALPPGDAGARRRVGGRSWSTGSPTSAAPPAGAVEGAAHAAGGAGARRAGSGPAGALGRSLRNPRTGTSRCTPSLLVLRGHEAILAPDDDFVLARATSCCSPAGPPPAARWDDPRGRRPSSSTS